MALHTVRQTARLVLFGAMLFVAACKIEVVGAAEDGRFFTIKNANTRLVENVFRLNAEIDFRLSEEAKEALGNGVPLVLEIQIQVLRVRPWLWNTVIATLTQRYRLQYHALSQRYLVKNLNTGVQSNFRSLDEVLRTAGTLNDFPMLDRNILETAQLYIGKMRADLDIEALPTPIRLWAYSSTKWRLGSEWYQWQLQQ